MDEMEEDRVNRRALSACENAHQNRVGRNDLKTYASGPREFIIGFGEMQELLTARPANWLAERSNKEVDIKKARDEGTGVAIHVHGGLDLAVRAAFFRQHASRTHGSQLQAYCAIRRNPSHAHWPNASL